MALREQVRYGGRLAGPWLPYHMTAITVSMSAPTTRGECVHLAGGTQVQWMLKNAGGASTVTAATLHFGRWVSTEGTEIPATHGHAIAGTFYEDGTLAITGLTDDEYTIADPRNTYGDPVAAYVTIDTGSVSGAGQTMRLWYRVLG